ncbi:hypothetical protein QZH41_006616 [Actinostola sp. cb2023]|nr:hypothetical protein QZH41_006616 [Actinostola sp. cb2023]
MAAKAEEDELTTDTERLIPEPSRQDVKNFNEAFELIEPINYRQPLAECCNCPGKTIMLLASSMAGLGGVLFGYDIGIVSGAILQLRDEFDMDCFQQEMIVSSMLIGAVIASLTGESTYA